MSSRRVATITRLPAWSTLPDGHLNGAQLVTATGISRRKVEYWTQAGYLHPLQTSTGSGYQRLYPPTEVAVARVMARLVDAGLNPQVASQLARELTDTGTTHIAGLPVHLPQEL